MKITKKLKKISILAATATFSLALCGAGMNNSVAFADETTTSGTKYALTDVFKVTDSNKDEKVTTIAAGTAEGYKTSTAITLNDGGSVKMKGSLAFTWFDKDGKAQYMSSKFAFDSLEFTSVTMTVESTSAWATKDDKATNTVTFTVKDKKVFAKVNDQKEVETAIKAKKDFTLSLAAGGENVDGAFAVKVDDTVVGKFENVGANCSEYVNDKMHPLSISAKAAAGKKAIVYVKNVNGQAFDNVAENKITDNAAPVLVVNEPINGFLLGTAFSLEYEAVDVLKIQNVTSPTFEYYQWNPSIKETDTEKYKKYKPLSTSTYFMDTVYEDEGKDTTVFAKETKEFVAIKATLTDGTNKETYNLADYAKGATSIKGDGLTYIWIDRNEKGPEYKYLEAKDGENVVKDGYAAAEASFKEALKAAAADVYAGSNSYIYLPSFKWLMNDNNGYRNMKFTISYKTPSSSSASTSSSLSYNALKLSATEEGTYEFKIFANDKAGNAMKYYDEDNKLVSVTSSNVWDIEGIPTFTYTVKNYGLKVEDPTKASDRKDTEVIGKTYTIDDIKVVGASSLKENYALYKVDLNEFNKKTASGKKISASTLSNVKYADLSAAVSGKTNGKNYFEFYRSEYAKLIAKEIGVEGETEIKLIENCFIEIKEYDSRITADNAPALWEEYNKYNWKPASQSFKTYEGSYLVLADYWEEELPSQRTAAYKFITVESKADKISGPSEWLKNNVVSVVLFSIAGVMLILIIILLLVKPSDETLEEVEEKAAKKSKKQKEE